jgi:hypothetical protein
MLRIDEFSRMIDQKSKYVKENTFLEILIKEKKIENVNEPSELDDHD